MIIYILLDYGGTFLFNKECSAKYFFQPLRHVRFLKNNKYKLIRFLAYISPWLIFPYTLFAYAVWVVVFIFLFILSIVNELIIELLKEKIDKFKLFWKEL